MRKYYLCASLSILCWSTVATITKLMLTSLSSWQVLFVSSFFAGASLLIFNIANKKIKCLATLRLPDYLKILGGFLPATLLYYVFYYSGTAIMPASQAFVVNYLWPVMSVIFAYFLLNERITPIKLGGILLSFTGVIIVISQDLIALNSSMLLGALFCVLGAISYGAFTGLSRKTGYDKSLSLMLSYFATFLITGLVLLPGNNLPRLDGAQMLGLAWNGIATMGLANMMWMLALSSKDTARISNLAYITPVLSLVWLAIFLKEPISVFSIIGLGVILLGIFIPPLYEKWCDRRNEKTQ